jgi:arginyl-tRNA synthetase
MGHDREAVQVILIAWVRFVRGGVVDSMSKRSGEFVSLDDLLAEIGSDAARWFFGSRAVSTGIDFDIELAKQQSAENPVYYVQYAHARCASIGRNAAEQGLSADASGAGPLLVHPAEQALIRRLLDLPDVVADAAERRETHEVTAYCLEVARLFSQFYRDCRVLPDGPEEVPLSQARLALTDAVRHVLANALGLLGISAPESM